MPDVLKLVATLLLIIVLLRKKVTVGYVMLISAAFLAVLYLMRPMQVLETVSGALIDPVTIMLALALTLIRIFELTLRECEVLRVMTEASSALLRNRKAVIVSMPMLIGMLPVVGGAYFSAPMVDEATKKLKMSAEEKGFINYWFRHPWEFVLPLYPGVILAAAISGVQLGWLILANAVPAALMLVGGLLLSMRDVKGRVRRKRLDRKDFLSFLPIASVLIMVVVLNMQLYLSFLIAIAGLFVVYGYSLRSALDTLWRGFSLDMVVLIIGVMIFKAMLEATGSVQALNQYFTLKGIPLLPMLLALPFITGILTGLTIGFVGVSFPLLASLAGGGSLGAVAIAFAAGYTGVLLSPVHVCLVLTREYFKAEMPGIYRYMVPAATLSMAGAVMLYVLIG